MPRVTIGRPRGRRPVYNKNSLAVQAPPEPPPEPPPEMFGYAWLSHLINQGKVISAWIAEDMYVSSDANDKVSFWQACGGTIPRHLNASGNARPTWIAGSPGSIYFNGSNNIMEGISNTDGWPDGTVGTAMAAATRNDGFTNDDIPRAVLSVGLPTIGRFLAAVAPGTASDYRSFAMFGGTELTSGSSDGYLAHGFGSIHIPGAGVNSFLYVDGGLARAIDHVDVFTQQQNVLRVGAEPLNWVKYWHGGITAIAYMNEGVTRAELNELVKEFSSKAIAAEDLVPPPPEGGMYFAGPYFGPSYFGIGHFG